MRSGTIVNKPPDSNRNAPGSAGQRNGPPADAERANPLFRQARLARDQRDAALRALAGRLAHQIRNPLAAVSAACTGLKEEVEDPDQRETLDLTLCEIERMLAFVRTTVDTIPGEREKPQNLDVTAELSDVVSIVSTIHAQGAAINLAPTSPLPVVLPRAALRVAVYSVLDHLAANDGIDAVMVVLGRQDERILIRFEISTADANGDVLSGDSPANGRGQPISLLIAERFARDQGGRLIRTDSGDATQTLTLDLPGSDV